MNTEFLFVRHGQTEGNAEKRFIGTIDLPLNDEGRKQARVLGKELKYERFDVMMHGQLKRVRETAEIIYEELLVKPATVASEKIRELRFGKFEGKTFAELEREYPEKIKSFLVNWSTFCYPKGECIADFFEHCRDFIVDVSQQYLGKKILIVGHNAFIVACVAVLKTGNIANMFDYSIENAGILRVSMEN